MQPAQEKYKYEYNGKEFQGEFSLNWSDLGARNLLSDIGRFINTDLLSEKYSFQSPYAFANNNPVRLVDVDGLGVDKKFDDFFFDTNGTLTNRVKNNEPDRFYLKKTTTENIIVINKSGNEEIMQINYNAYEEISLDSDIGYTARAVYGEAAGQNKETKLAVAEVIRNRKNDNTKPSSKNNYMAQFSDKSTAKDVIENTGFDASTEPRYQDTLSFIGGNGKKGNRNEIRTKAFVDSMGASIKAYKQNSNTTDGATYFYSPGGKTPSWTKDALEVNVPGVDTTKFKFYKYPTEQ